MPIISFMTHFYNHPRQVQDQITYWESLPPEFLSQVEFVLVDDYSEQSPTLRATKLDLKAFRISTDISWNQSGARNLGAFNASGNWIIFFDIDQKFRLDAMQRILANITKFDDMTLHYLRSDNAFDANIGNLLPFHSNTYLINLRKFKIYGMFDEDFAGHYGYEDLYMSYLWGTHGGKRSVLNEVDFFEDLGFATANLDRDLNRNKLLQEQKIKAGTGNSTGILRFKWEQVKIGTI